MQNQPSTFRFTLRAMFICTAFAGLGLVVLKDSNDRMPIIVNLAVELLIVYAIIAALARTGRRRLFWAAFAATAVLIFINDKGIYRGFFYELAGELWALTLQHLLIPGGAHQDQWTAFLFIGDRLCLILISTAAAYIIPWLVQRGQKPSGD